MADRDAPTVSPLKCLRSKAMVCKVSALARNRMSAAAVQPDDAAVRRKLRAEFHAEEGVLAASLKRAPDSRFTLTTAVKIPVSSKVTPASRAAWRVASAALSRHIAHA